MTVCNRCGAEVVRVTPMATDFDGDWTRNFRLEPCGHTDGYTQVEDGAAVTAGVVFPGVNRRRIDERLVVDLDRLLLECLDSFQMILGTPHNAAYGTAHDIASRCIDRIKERRAQVFGFPVEIG